MRISIVAAMGKNRVIGLNNKLPWKRISADMERFKDLTLGKVVVMGRRTFESIGRALPNRANIVLTRDKAYDAKGCIVANSVDEVLSAALWYEELAVIGGAQVYEQFLPLADYMHLTLVEGEFEGDTFFPPFDSKDWEPMEREVVKRSERNPYKLVFVTFRKRGL